MTRKLTQNTSYVPRWPVWKVQEATFALTMASLYPPNDRNTKNAHLQGLTYGYITICTQKPSCVVCVGKQLTNRLRRTQQQRCTTVNEQLIAISFFVAVFLFFGTILLLKNTLFDHVKHFALVFNAFSNAFVKKQHRANSTTLHSMLLVALA